MGRWIRFFIAILVGVGLGLLYGWVISPVEYVDTSPDTLRIDYKTDYVLMVAEAFQGDNDLALALRRLALLGGQPPVDLVQQALLFGQANGYIDADLERMQFLLNAIQVLNLAQETPPP
jgi:hypothetical protein